MSVPQIRKPKRLYTTIYACIFCCFLSACSNTQVSIEKQDSGPTEEIDLSHVTDAVPKKEIWARYGNHTPYFVLGKTYEVLDSNEHFKQEGIASWYGTKFHGELTSTREAYDMYAMTAAHKTLPLPSYVLVTNLENQKQIVVRVNDRGPFKDGRIIDLSYAAAHKIDMHEQGTAQVHIEVLPPFLSKPIKGNPEQSSVVLSKLDFPMHKSNYLQVGVYSNEKTANDLQLSLVRSVPNNVIVIKQSMGNTTLYKVRIGPIKSFEDLETIQAVLIKNNLPHFYMISE
jgi:rare lipoprotein A